MRLAELPGTVRDRFTEANQMTQTADQRPTYHLVLRPEPDKSDPRGIRRLRAFLKAALRGYRLRCVRVEPTPTGTGESENQLPIPLRPG